MRLVTICGASYVWLMDHEGRVGLYFVKQTGKPWALPGVPDHSARDCPVLCVAVQQHSPFVVARRQTHLPPAFRTERFPHSLSLGFGNRFAPPTSQQYWNHE